MSKRIYSNHDLNQYLLGALPEAEAESFDELSFTDEEFADALSAVEKDLVDAYVQGELGDPELERFKSYYLASSLRRERLKFAQAFKVLSEQRAVAQVAVGGQAKSATRPKGVGWFSGLSILGPGRPGLQWGFAAAALALIIVAGWLVFDDVRLRRQVSQAEARRDELLHREQELQNQIKTTQQSSSATEQELGRLSDQQKREQQNVGEQHQSSSSGLSIASFILAPPLRGAGQIRRISVPDKTDSVAMQLGLEPNDYSAYRVALIDQSGNQTVWRSNALKAKVGGDTKTISVSFRAVLLKPQTYVLRVSGISAKGATEIIGDYPFRVVKSDNSH